ncbi:MAG: hypothetical protein ACPLRN_02160, partial [Microgenomates group bacterium]
MADAEPQVTLEVAKGIAAGLVEKSPALPTGVTLPPEVSRAVEAHKAGQAEKALQMLAGEVCPYTPEDVKGAVL